MLLNFGTVYIRVSTEVLTFDNVYQPSKVQETSSDRCRLPPRRPENATSTRSENAWRAGLMCTTSKRRHKTLQKD